MAMAKKEICNTKGIDFFPANCNLTPNSPLYNKFWKINMINERLEKVNIFQSFINLVNEYFTDKTLSVDGRMISKFSG